MYSLNKDAVINTATEFPLYFFDAAGAATTAGAAVKMLISGYGEFTNDAVTNVNGYKATPSQKEILTIDASTPAHITVAQGATVADTQVAIDTIVNFAFEILTDNNEVQYGRDQLRAGMVKTYQTVALPSYGAGELTAADAATAIAGHLLVQLHNLITQEAVLSDLPYTSLISYDAVVDSSAKAVGPFTDIKTVSVKLVAQSEHIFLEEANAYSDENTASSLVTVFAPAVTTVRIPGRGTGKLLRENVRMLTDVSVRPYGDLNHELPIDGANYTEINFAYTRTRTDQNLGVIGVAGSTEVKSRSKHVLYIREDASTSTYRSNILTFFGQNNPAIALFNPVNTTTGAEEATAGPNQAARIATFVA